MLVCGIYTDISLGGHGITSARFQKQGVRTHVVQKPSRLYRFRYALRYDIVLCPLLKWECQGGILTYCMFDFNW